jgi:hypothetical protein
MCFFRRPEIEGSIKVDAGGEPARFFKNECAPDYRESLPVAGGIFSALHFAQLVGRRSGKPVVL